MEKVVAKHFQQVQGLVLAKNYFGVRGTLKPEKLITHPLSASAHTLAPNYFFTSPDLERNSILDWRLVWTILIQRSIDQIIILYRKV